MKFRNREEPCFFLTIKDSKAKIWQEMESNILLDNCFDLGRKFKKAKITCSDTELLKKTGFFFKSQLGKMNKLKSRSHTDKVSFWGHRSHLVVTLESHLIFPVQESMTSLKIFSFLLPEA